MFRRGTRNRLPAIVIIFVILDELVGGPAIVDGFEQFDWVVLLLLLSLKLLLLMMLGWLVLVVEGMVEGAVTLGPLLLLVVPPNQGVPKAGAAPAAHDQVVASLGKSYMG